MSKLALKLIKENKKIYKTDPEKAKFLDLGNCGLTDLPKALFECGWIENLSFGDFFFNKDTKRYQESQNGAGPNRLIEKGLVNLALLSNLKTLTLSENPISDYSFLEKLTNLNSLDLSNNQIRDIGSGDVSIFEKLTDLNSLYLRSNKISDIGSGDVSLLEKLTNLNSLYLSNNKIRDYSFLEKLTNLNSLYLRNNKIRDISFLEKLTNLSSLDLSNNIISDISSLEKLTNLNSLDLSNNKISDIGSGDVSLLEKLTNLNSLYLRNNKISDISSLEKLTNLNSLDLRNNKISDISSLEKLTLLENLLLHNNEISDFQSLRRLTKLKKLSIGGHSIIDETLFKYIMLFLVDFPTVKFVSNTLPKWFIEWVFNLQISEILINSLKQSYVRTQRYEDAAFLRDKEKRYLDNFPIIERDKNDLIVLYLKFLHQQTKYDYPAIEIVNQGWRAIDRYFEKLEREGKDYIYEAKLTLVGDGGAGKTSLQRKILKENAQLPSGDERTRGIEVIDWEFKDRDGNNYTAHIWDFGGQDVYYPVHRFFLTDNAVYVLMASTRFSVHNFEYWIPTIFQFGGKSPIVLVQNCDNGNQKSWDDVNIFYTNPEYNLCRPFYKINLKSDDTQELKKLKNYLEQHVIQLPHIGKVVPKSWVKVREALQEKAIQTDIITYTDFEIVCRNADAEAFEKAIDIEDLGKFLHDLGIILWYYDKPELKHLVILKPEWAMNAVYKIIDDEQIQQQQGIIHQEDFERVWQEEKYRSKTHELKVMLQVFKIAFPKKQNKQDYILPARLLPISEDKKWENNEPYLRLEYHFEFMPRGIVNQVSAELSSSILSDSSVWNNAVTFQNQAGEAQMIEEYHHRKIQIKAKGRDARGILLLIMNEVVDIVKEYRGVHPTIKVPCSCKECRNLEKPTTFEYGELVGLLNKNRKEVTCNKGDVRLNVFDLLHSVGLEYKENDKLFESKTEHLMKPIEEIPEIFFSYAWGDAQETGVSREDIVNRLYDNLKSDGLAVKRDKIDLGYKGLISDFMDNIGKSSFLVVALSNKYLESQYCMFELYEAYRNAKFEKAELVSKIYPIRVENIKLDDPDILDKYFEHWEKLEKKWENLIVKRGTRITKAQQAEYDKIKNIASRLGDLLEILSDMNALTKELLSDNNFEKIKSAIKQRIGQ